MKPTQLLRAKLDAVRKASQVAEVKAPPPPQEVKLSAAAADLPEHIRQVTDARKLNSQTPFFKCPAWADLPSKAYHLFVTRDGVPFPALELLRFPFYLLGKSPVCDYVLEHPSISSVHAAIVFHKAQNCFVLVDLASTNGSRVDGKVVEARKPVPLPVGAVLQFGYSSRQYTVCAGPPPSAKRIREEQEEAIQLKHKAELPSPSPASSPAPAVPVSLTTAASSSSPNHAHDNTPATAAQPPRADVAAHAVGVSLNDTAASSAAPVTSPPATEGPAEEEASVAPPPAEEVKRMHLFQLVIKHKDVKNPVSKGRNKGEIITRSAADAVQMAQFILRQHEASHAEEQASGAGSSKKKAPFVPWTVEAFTAAVVEYCEMSNAKKKGDLGIVEEGTFAPAFDEAAFRLRRHEVSQPVETELGIHLIYRCD